MCTLKDDGGMGFRNLVKFNIFFVGEAGVEDTNVSNILGRAHS